ncbi:MAG: S8 family peptidase [Alphaproteobacteria bacterium]|nr:S8 family peptidase [Alphaproteobacteria bacterium]
MFEVTGSVQDFAKAVSRIAGLEFAGEEELTPDEFDTNPEFYLLVPQLDALKEIVSLWKGWQQTGTVPRNYGPWRHLFAQLRDVRPWGPADRVSLVNREYFHDRVDGAPDNEAVRIEIEFVFRPSTDSRHVAEADVADYIATIGGAVIDRSQRPEFAYHAVLADVPTTEIRRIADLDPTSLAGADPVALIVPQSVGTPIEVAERTPVDVVRPDARLDEPIAAIFDAVPMQAHPLLDGRLRIDDSVNLEARAVGPRVHGTAMASIVLHGDLNDSPTPIRRRVYFRPVMYAPSWGDEVFDNNRLIVDVIVEAVMRMRASDGKEVIVVNLSLGDRTRPFAGNISTWARALDYLAFTYGILFLVSAGNATDGVSMVQFADAAAFEAVSATERAEAVLRAVDAMKANRRLLAPGDSLNALTIGAWHRDSSTETFRGRSPFVPYDGQEMPNVSSRLGLGLRRSTKPEALFAGGRQPARLAPVATPPVLLSHPHPSRFWGLKVVAPTENGAMGLHFTMGTSAATALATHSAHRIFDALEDTYPELIARMPLAERACLLKALLVHSASWRGSGTFIRSVIDPDEKLNHEHWRREVCRYLGYGFVDPDDAIACAVDRATMWATGAIGPEGSATFDVPIPAIFGSNANPREVRATLAWFAPTRPGNLAYRAVKLRIPSLQADVLEIAGVDTLTGQPTNSQSESGTIIHRRCHDARIGGGGATIPVQIQRERDQGLPIDEAISFGFAISLEMPGAVELYDQILPNIQVQPRTRVRP